MFRRGFHIDYYISHIHFQLNDFLIQDPKKVQDLRKERTVETIK